MAKKILYIDMDGVLADEKSAFKEACPKMVEKYKDNMKDLPGLAGAMLPMKDAIDSVNELTEIFDVYILSTARWTNNSVWIDKVHWIKRYFGEDKDSPLFKRLILTNNKGLVRGDFLVDDNSKNGVKEFEGEWVHFGSDEFPNWKAVVKYLKDKA